MERYRAIDPSCIDSSASTRVTGQPTIYALSSGVGKAGVAVIRLSGGQTADVLRAVAGHLPLPRVATLLKLVHPSSQIPLDQALVLWFPAPRSFTGEDCAELHVHGGRAVISSVLEALSAFDGLRLAEPGEFARRAFFNGKLDLTQAEALADLVDADTEAQRRQALRHMSSGGLGDRAEAWRGSIIKAQALCEAAIDFSDEGDVATDALAQAASVATSLRADLMKVLADARRGEIVREGFRVAIIGAPNVGKSSLLNALSRRDAAIVSEEPGTTRDVVEVALDLGGMAVIVSDTAGVREGAGRVEQEGIRRSFRTAEHADLILALSAVDIGAGTFPPELHRNLENLSAEVVDVVNKIDLLDANAIPSCIGISTRTGQGIDILIDLIAGRAGAVMTGDEPALITRERQRILIAEACAALEAFDSDPGRAIELRAEDLRQAAHALGRMTGRVDAEDVLGEIFGRFCIGK